MRIAATKLAGDENEGKNRPQRARQGAAPIAILWGGQAVALGINIRPVRKAEGRRPRTRGAAPSVKQVTLGRPRFPPLRWSKVRLQVRVARSMEAPRQLVLWR